MKSLQKIATLLFTLTIIVSCSKSNDSTSAGGCATECSYTIAAGETAGTVPSALDGTYNLTYHHAQTGSPFTDGTKAKLTINSNVITIEIDGKECITLKNPIKTSPTESTFIDNCRDNLKYAVSESTNGGLNEMNVSSTAGKWLGQFKE